MSEDLLGLCLKLVLSNLFRVDVIVQNLPVMDLLVIICVGKLHFFIDGHFLD